MGSVSRQAEGGITRSAEDRQVSHLETGKYLDRPLDVIRILIVGYVAREEYKTIAGIEGKVDFCRNIEAR